MKGGAGRGGGGRRGVFSLWYVLPRRRGNGIATSRFVWEPVKCEKGLSCSLPLLSFFSSSAPRRRKQDPANKNSSLKQNNTKGLPLSFHRETRKHFHGDATKNHYCHPLVSNLDKGQQGSHPPLSKPAQNKATRPAAAKRTKLAPETAPAPVAAVVVAVTTVDTVSSG